MKNVFKGFGILFLFLITTGIALPWIISNVVMPLWMIMASVILLGCVWCLIFKKAFRESLIKLFKSLKDPIEPVKEECSCQKPKEK